MLRERLYFLSLFKKATRLLHSWVQRDEVTRWGRLCPTEGLRRKGLVRRDSVRKSEASSLDLDDSRKKAGLDEDRELCQREA